MMMMMTREKKLHVHEYETLLRSHYCRLFEWGDSVFALQTLVLRHSGDLTGKST